MNKNQTRKEVMLVQPQLIADDIAKTATTLATTHSKLFPLIGIYMLDSNSDNSNESTVIAILDILKDKYKHFQFIVFDKERSDITNSKDVICIGNLESFIKGCDIIVTNRMDEALEKVKEKVYTLDIFSNNEFIQMNTLRGR